MVNIVRGSKWRYIIQVYSIQKVYTEIITKISYLNLAHNEK